MRDLAPQLSIGAAQSEQEHVDERAPGKRSLTETMVRRQARDARGVAGDAPEALERAAGSGGVQLPEGLAARLATGLGADLGGVRLHTGEASAEAADALGARAFAVGQDIHFGAGEYDPASQGGQRLIAHEVAHTLQQGAGATPQLKSLEVSQPGDRAELEADQAADRVLAGETDVAASLGGAGPRLQRELRGNLPGAGSTPGRGMSFTIMRMADVVNWVDGRAVSRRSFAGVLRPGSALVAELDVDAGSRGALRLDLQGMSFQDNLVMPSNSEYNHILRWDYVVTPQGDITTLTPHPQEIHDGNNNIALTTTTQEDTSQGLVRIALNYGTSGTGPGGGLSAGPVSGSSSTSNHAGGHTFILTLRLNIRNRQAAPAPAPAPVPARPVEPAIPSNIATTALFGTGEGRLTDAGISSLNDWTLSLDRVPHLTEAVESGLVPIHIIGRASELGTIANNMRHSQNRVDEIQVLLVGRLGRSGARTGGLMGDSVQFRSRAVGEFGARAPINNPLERSALVYIEAGEARRGIMTLLERQQQQGGGAAPGGGGGR